MEIPDLVRQELGDEAVQSGVSLGDDDLVCFTPTRALVYRGEGLLSDEKIETYPLGFERLGLSEGRRKATFSFTYVDEKRELSVPLARVDPLLQQFLEGTLHVASAVDDQESVAGVFRFSELTLVVTEGHLLKHVGNATWDGDYERFSFEDLTGLQFEPGSVATAIVVAFGDRPERIKAPNEQAPSVRKTLEETLFAFHDVDSLDALNEKVGPEEAEESDAAAGLGLESGIDPLVSDDDSPAESGETAATAGSGRAESADSGEQHSEGGSQTASLGPSVDTVSAESESLAEDLAALEAQIEALTAAVEQQSEQLQRQEQTIEQLIAELRQGR